MVNAVGGGDVVGFHVPEDVKARVPQSRQVLWRIASKDWAAVLAERFIAHIVQPIFDHTLVVACQCWQSLCGGNRATQRCYEVSQLHTPFPLDRPLSLHLTDLFAVRPGDVAVESGGARERPTLKADYS